MKVLQQNISIHNRFDIEVKDSITGKIKQKATAYNMILDTMWVRLCGGDYFFKTIVIGTGTGTLSKTRTGPFTYLTYKNVVPVEIIRAFPVSSVKNKIILSPEEFVGSVITEVGVAYSTSSMVTHAMLQDAEGNPISITKTAVDIITIYATIFSTLNETPDIELLGIPDRNLLISYLTGGSGPSNYLYFLPSKYGENKGYSNGSDSPDVPNKIWKTTLGRLPTTSLNAHLQYVQCNDTFRMKLTDITGFNGQPYTGVSLGSGDDVKKLFPIPSLNLIDLSITVKIDGLTNTEYSVEKSNTINHSAVFPRDEIPVGDDSLYSGPMFSKDNKYMIQGMSSPRATLHLFEMVEFNTITEKYKVCRPTIPRDTIKDGFAPYQFTYGAISNDGNRVFSYYNHNYGASSGYALLDFDGEVWVNRLYTTYASSSRACLTSLGDVIAYQSAINVVSISDVDIDGVCTPRPNPATVGDIRTHELTDDGNTVAITTKTGLFLYVFDWVGGEWIKRNDPISLPEGSDAGLSITDDGLSVALSLGVSPYIAVYDYVIGEAIRREIPTLDAKFIGAYMGFLDTNNLIIEDSATGEIISWFSNKSIVTLAPKYETTEYPQDKLFLRGMDFKGQTLSKTGSNFYNTFIDVDKRQSYILFDTPPTNASAITVDYTVDGIHKTDQFVLDSSYGIQFGGV